MIRKVSLLVFAAFLLTLSSGAAFAANLTGVWKGNDGGFYYLRQVGTEIWWIGDGLSLNPRFYNVAHGKISGKTINLSWADVPYSAFNGRGKLVLRIDSATHLVAVKNPGFGGSDWTFLCKVC